MRSERYFVLTNRVVPNIVESDIRFPENFGAFRWVPVIICGAALSPPCVLFATLSKSIEKSQIERSSAVARPMTGTLPHAFIYSLFRHIE